jgi:hypothetical protein
VPAFADAADDGTEFTSEYLPEPREPAMRIAPRSQRRADAPQSNRGASWRVRMPWHGDR